MTFSKIIAAVGVNLVAPFLGVVAFALFYRWMWRARIQSPPFFSWFVLFATFGGWLVLLLTALFWEWSGMASLGFLYLVLVAPVGTAALAWSLYRRRAMSGFHRSAFVASISYSGLVLATLLGWLVARLLAS